MDDRSGLANVERTVQQVLDLPERERERFLDEACGDNAEFRAMVEAVLARSLENLPSGPPSGEVTRILASVKGGDQAAHDQLLTVVYNDLKEIALRLLHRERRPDLPQASSLVNRAYLKLFGRGPTDMKNRRYFFGAATNAMRQIICDIARRPHVVCNDEVVKQVEVQSGLTCEDLTKLDAVLDELAATNERLAEIAKLRILGLKLAEIARALDVSESLIKKEMRLVRALLHRRLHPVNGD